MKSPSHEVNVLMHLKENVGMLKRLRRKCCQRLHELCRHERDQSQELLRPALEPAGPAAPTCRLGRKASGALAIGPRPGPPFERGNSIQTIQ